MSIALGLDEGRQVGPDVLGQRLLGGGGQRHHAAVREDQGDGVAVAAEPQAGLRDVVGHHHVATFVGQLLAGALDERLAAAPHLGGEPDQKGSGAGPGPAQLGQQVGVGGERHGGGGGGAGGGGSPPPPGRGGGGARGGGP